MAISGLNVSFVLDSVDISAYLFDIQVNSDRPREDATTYQATRRTFVSGIPEETWTIKGRYTSAADTYFRARIGSTGLAYTFGPQGDTTGDPRWTGTADVLNYEVDSLPVDGVVNFTAEIVIVSKSIGVYP